MTDRPWRLIPWWVGPADKVLAAGDLLLEQATHGWPALQWYGVVPDALILGPRQRQGSIVNWAACWARGITVYARRSGGTAVLADRDLINLDVALPPGHPLSPADVTRAYAWLGEALAAGLRVLGVPAQCLSPEAVRAGAERRGGTFWAAEAACFGGLSPYEIVAGGRKIVGLSQVRRRQCTLFQVGLPLRWHAADLTALLTTSSHEQTRLSAELAGCAAGLAEWGLDETRLADIIAVLTAHVALAAHAHLEERAWSVQEHAAISLAADAQYAPVLPGT